MKHRINWLLAAAYAVTLLSASGCTGVNAAGPVSEEAPAETEEREEPKITSSYGKAEGTLGDIMKASFMEFRLNAAATADQYQTLIADEGMKLLVLNITTHVTQKNPLKLYDTDYQIQWGGEGELDYSEPVTYRDEWADFVGYKNWTDLGELEGMFPGTAVLASEETITYDYVYQVPEGLSEFYLLFQEYFEDESVGDLFIVSFKADPAGVIDGPLGKIEPFSGTAELPAADAPAEGEAVQAG